MSMNSSTMIRRMSFSGTDEKPRRLASRGAAPGSVGARGVEADAVGGVLPRQARAAEARASTPSAEDAEKTGSVTDRRPDGPVGGRRGIG